VDELAIEARDIGFSYGTVPVLNDVSFTVETGEIVGIIGPNGSGKTTLLKILSRTLQPQCGSVHILGEDLREIHPRALARQVAVVPQSSSIAFPFRVSEIVLMGRNPYQGRLPFETRTDRRITADAMRATDTFDLADRRITELSGGEMQRVIIARALAQQPRILLLDEPTVHLDLHHQIAVYEILSQLNAEHNMTIVAVSHDLNLAAIHCRRLALLSHGEIVAGGTPGEVVTEENLDRVYGVDVPVTRSDVTGLPVVLPVSREKSGMGKTLSLTLSRGEREHAREREHGKKREREKE